MYIDVGIEATACAHSADTIRYDTIKLALTLNGVEHFVLIVGYFLTYKHYLTTCLVTRNAQSTNKV